MNKQLGSMIQELDNYLNENYINNLFVFGDVTSTLAGAIVAKNNSIKYNNTNATTLDSNSL